MTKRKQLQEGREGMKMKRRIELKVTISIGEEGSKEGRMKR